MVQPHPKIVYAFALPSWKPHEVTPFQGFAPGLLDLGPALHSIVHLPPDILELTMPERVRLARRRAGAGEYMWSPINVETLIKSGKPTPQLPFMVVFTGDKEIARQIAIWRRGLRIRPLHVSSTGHGGSIKPSDLTVSLLQRHCRNALHQAKKVSRHLEVADSKAAIDRWQPLESRSTSLRYHNHNVTAPNEMVLVSTGEVSPAGDEGALNVSPHDDYVAGITESALAVQALQAQVGEHLATFRIWPSRPDLFLLAPSTYRGIERILRNAVTSPAARRALGLLERQREYTMTFDIEDESDIDKLAPLLTLRGAELKLQTTAVGIRASSTLAATVRLPPLVNRTSGVVDQLARHMRAYDEKLPDRKTAKVFQLVQSALLDAVPAQHLDLIKSSKSGIKIIGNAPLEWLPINGLPLGLHADVSRIPATPGNIMIEQLRPAPQHFIAPAEFRHYLALSMFDTDDPISGFIGHALQRLPGSEGTRLTGTLRSPQNVDEFVESINAYDGPLLIVDSHGQHPESDIGGLVIGGQPVDVWSLRNRLRLPPIIVLSACDTHPFDRSHATIANGFLSCGAVAVLATTLPVRARPAAIFLRRLMLRAIEFGELTNLSGLAVPWTNIVSGALRMQLVSDICRALESRGILTESQGYDIQFKGNQDLNPMRRDWLSRLAARCQKAAKIDTTQWEQLYPAILAASDVIRYVHLGNPENIILGDASLVGRMADGEPEQPLPGR